MQLTKRSKAFKSSVEFMQSLLDADTTSEAKDLLATVYSGNSETTATAFTSQVESKWDVFYAMLATENKFSLEHNASAYHVIGLIEPKLKGVWAKRDALPLKKWSSYDDFKVDVFIMIHEKLSPVVNKKGNTVGFDMEKNDNFLAYISPELNTVLNEITDQEISKHLAKVHGLSLHSLEGLTEDERNPIQVRDHCTNVEETVSESIDPEHGVQYRQIKNAEYDEEKKCFVNMEKLVSDTLTSSLLFGGLDDSDLVLS